MSEVKSSQNPRQSLALYPHEASAILVDDVLSTLISFSGDLSRFNCCAGDHIAWDAIECSCGSDRHLVCKACFQSLSRVGDLRCPVGRHVANWNHSELANSVMRGFSVECPLCDKKVQLGGNMETLKAHIKNCKFMRTCPNADCKQRFVFSWKWNEHKKACSPKVKCPDCGDEILSSQLDYHKRVICDMKKETCQGCGLSSFPAYSKIHKYCNKYNKYCKYSKIGCNERFQEVDRAKHDIDFEQHHRNLITEFKKIAPEDSSDDEVVDEEYTSSSSSAKKRKSSSSASTGAKVPRKAHEPSSAPPPKPILRKLAPLHPICSGVEYRSCSPTYSPTSPTYSPMAPVSLLDVVERVYNEHNARASSSSDP